MHPPRKIIPPFADPYRPLNRDLGNLSGELGAAMHGSFVADLGHLGILSFTGEDAASFLQGQLSCDVEPLRLAPSSSFGAYCSPKGRMLASFLLWHHQGIWHMALSRAIAPSVQKRLSMYVLRAKVRISAPQDMVLIGTGGHEAWAALKEIAGMPPLEAHAVHTNENANMTVLGLPGNRGMLMLPATAAEGIWENIVKQAMPAGTGAWEWGDVHNGIPWITTATQDQFVPQMLNMELIGGVSFRKGCYPGQEIVARTQHLGKVKRRMYLAHAAASAADGMELHSDNVDGQSNGMVVNAVPAIPGGSDMLVVVQRESAEHFGVHLAAPDGPLLNFLPLPYSLG